MDESSDLAQNRTVTVLKIHGYVERVMAQQVECLFDAAFASGCFRIVVDLSETDYLSSSGWGMFIGEIKRVREGGGDIILAAMRPGVLEIFELLEFNRVLRHYDSVDEAVHAFEPEDQSAAFS